MLNETLGQIGFWLFFIGLNGTFLPMHWLGLEGMPRRYASYEVFAKAVSRLRCSGTSSRRSSRS